MPVWWIFAFLHRLTEFVTAAKELAVVGAAAFATWCAWRALGEWRKKLTGETEYNLARRLLKAALMIRGRMGVVRQVVVSEDEFALAVKKAGGSADARSAEKVAYEMRWQHLQEPIAEFSAQGFEAEVLWGAEAGRATNALYTCIGRLSRAIEIYLRTPDRVTDDLLGIVFETGGEDDTFTQEIDAAVEMIEDFLRPKLHP